MDEYISKTKFEELMRKKARSNFDLYYVDKAKHYHDKAIGYNTAADEAHDFPTADVQPIKRGRWIDCTFYDPCEKSWEQNYEFKCSNCGHKIYDKPNDDNLFCGHCSARMDGDAE
jgi:NADH pyrophosphatase NudC (nudix superfamily)